MTSIHRLKMEIDLLEKRRKASDSDLRYKTRQYNDSMPCDPEMVDKESAFLKLMSIERDRDRLDVEIAEKRLQLYSLQAPEVAEGTTLPEPSNNTPDTESSLPVDLHDERPRIDAPKQKPEAEQAPILGFDLGSGVPPTTWVISTDNYSYPSELHIVRLLKEAGANSKSSAIDRNWLNGQLINKVERVNTRQAVDFGLIELKRKGVIDYEGKPKRVWIV